MGEKNIGLTLIELLVSIVIFSLIMIALTTISAFSYRTIIDGSRRSDLQLQASFIVDHITKNVQRTIGSPVYKGMLTPVDPPVYPNYTIAMRTDYNRDGIPNDDGAGQWIAYNYVPASYQLDYFATYTRPGAWPTAGGEPLSSQVTGFSLMPIDGTNYVSLQVTVCYDPDGSPYACGTKDNPSITMDANIDIPMNSIR